MRETSARGCCLKIPFLNRFTFVGIVIFNDAPNMLQKTLKDVRRKRIGFEKFSVLRPNRLPPLRCRKLAAHLCANAPSLAKDQHFIDVRAGGTDGGHVEPFTKQQVLGSGHACSKVVRGGARLLKHRFVQIRLAFRTNESDVGVDGFEMLFAMKGRRMP